MKENLEYYLVLIGTGLAGLLSQKSAYKFAGWLGRVVYHLLDSIANDRSPEPDFFDGLKNQAVMEAMSQSAQDGRWHDVEKVEI